MGLPPFLMVFFFGKQFLGYLLVKCVLMEYKSFVVNVRMCGDRMNDMSFGHKFSVKTKPKF